MPSTGSLGEAPRKELHVFYVLDTSGSMEGAKISSLNHAMEECTEALKELAQKNGDAKLKIAVLEFSSGCRWVTNNGPESMEDFEWEYLESGGLTDIGEALKELNSKLSRRAYLNSMTGAFMPVIIFMTDGLATDEWEKPLEEIRNNKWFMRGTKIGFAVGEDADTAMISSIVGNKEAVIKTTDLTLFEKLIKFVTVRSSMLKSESRIGTEKIGGKDIVKDAIKELGIENDITPELEPNQYDPEPEEEPVQSSEADSWYADEDW